jgi:hypothetical protein
VHLAKAQEFSGFLNDRSTIAAQSRWPAQAYMRDGAGDMRAAAFVRLENFSTDIAPVQAHLGFDIRMLPRVNESKRARDYRSYYSSADADLIAQICTNDIAQFGYAFDPIKF